MDIMLIVCVFLVYIFNALSDESEAHLKGFG